MLTELDASASSDLPLVDNEPLIEVLNTAKSKSVEISKALEVAAETNENIEKNRDTYRDAAMRGAILFFSIDGLSAISSMYEYSLSSYMTVFINALNTAKKDAILLNRLKNIKDMLTKLVYNFTCMGIFKRHKLMYSFQMTTMIMDGAGELNKIELDFFLKGNTSLDAVEAKKPYEWISDYGWKDIQKLESLGECWANLVPDLRSNGADWLKWYDLEVPEKAEIPCGYTQKLNKFQVLLLMRVLRPDRVSNTIVLFIQDRMGDQYTRPPIVEAD